MTETDGPFAEDAGTVPDDDDAFSASNIGVVQFITLARIYDVLVALLETQDADKHRELLEAHSKGILLGPSPVFQGIFVTDEVNETP